MKSNENSNLDGVPSRCSQTSVDEENLKAKISENKRVASLEKLRDTDNETIDTRQDAGLLIVAIENFNFLTYLLFWSEILSSIDRVQKILQAEDISFYEALTHIQMLTDKIMQWRNFLCGKVIAEAEEKALPLV